MSKFPMTIKTASNAKALQNTIPSTLGGRFPADDEDVLLELAKDPNLLFIVSLETNVLTFGAEAK